ncbi:zf-HC2 domain-containing protein [Granulicella mallensis]|uniref:Zinc-finger domain-containing protein n=1 Tax=Granulicella mallensis TaxID=940614 RepID=A0A7W8E972_9BACT|nr:zf-HC2 domain-containing protein [Granulicella mallensis]MBB5063467.1 hypothetical protein [Granulicella mallensis]
MSDLLQPGQHLEADQLNAFLEGVLPEHERLESLAHLSECSHCRQIVFLARQAQQAEEPAPAKAVPTWREWFRFSPMSMLSAATIAVACALIVTVSLHLYRTAQTPTTMENAKVELAPNLPPIAPPAEAAPPAPRRASPKAAPVSPIAAAPEPVAPAPSGKAEDAISSFSKRRSATTEPAISPQTTKPTAMNDFVAASAGAVSNHEARGTGMLLRNRTAAPLQPAKAAAPLAAKSNPIVVAAAPALPTTTETLPIEARTTIQATNETVEVSAAPNGAIDKLNEDNEALRKRSKVHALPSNLPSAASASNGRRMLAADTAGALFLSKNGGKHWKSVKPQWQGKVMQLALSPRSLQQPALQKQKVEAGFQLTTDSGVVWVSGDGVHWQQK